MINKYLMIGFFLLESSLALGQRNLPNPSLSTVPVPPPPEAASFEKYIQTPTGTYTGVPKIEIPLLIIQNRDLVLPISLSYHAGGFRVTDEASWVGLGWTLNAGGSITRTIKDKNDFYGWLRPANAPVMDPALGAMGTNGEGSDQACNNLYFGDSYAGKYGQQDLTCIAGYFADGVLVKRDFTDILTDWEPDNFSYNFCGNNGQFVFNQKGNISLVQKSKLLFNYSNNTQGNLTWKVINSEGFKYFFETAANSYTESASFSNGGETEWYLTKIISPRGEQATFNYETSGDIISQPSLSKYQTIERTGTLVPGEPTEITSISYSHSFAKYLTRIDFSTGYIIFQRSSSNRLDLNGSQALQAIKLYSKAGKLIKQFEFNTSYFESPVELTENNFSSIAQNQNNSFKDKRLRLDNIIEKSENLAKPATKFIYNSISLPSKTSYDIDFWGFNNYDGAKHNSDLLPRYEGLFGVSGITSVFPGANRIPNVNAMQAAMLQKIIYPTGGSTAYIFEPNEYNNLIAADQYANVGNQVISVYRDDTNPYYNTPTQTFTLTDQRPGLSTKPTIPIHINLLFTYNRTNSGYASGDEKARTTVTITGSNGYTRSWGFDDSHPYTSNGTTQQVDEYVELSPGTYTVVASTPGNKLQYPEQISLRGDISWQLYKRQYNKIGGGLRIARVVNFDNYSRKTVARTYEYSHSITNSSGQLITISDGIIASKPVFTRKIDLQNGVKLFQICSTSRNSLATPITYGQVTTYIDSAKTAGKTVSYFINEPLREPLYNQRDPAVPLRPNLTNGYPLSEDIYIKTSTGYVLLNNTTTYFEELLNPDIRAIYRGATHKGYEAGGGTFDQYQDMHYYPVVTGWVRPVKTVKSNVSPTGTFTQATTLVYDERQVGHMQVTTRSVERSDGSHEITKLTYPADYSEVITGALAAMRSDALYQHSAVVESVTQVYGPTETLAQARTTGGTYTEYSQPNSTSAYLPFAKRALELSQPTLNLEVAAPSLPSPNRYVLQTKFSYEPATANIRQANKAHDTPTSFLWGYGGTLLVAQLQNATASQVRDALANLGFTPSTLPEEEQSLRQLMKQLQKTMPQAYITSFTHQPLVGMTSQTGPDGRTTTYEYDGLGRLVRTRDEQGRILSQQQYHYAGQ